MMEKKRLNRNGDKRGMSPNSRKNLEKRNLKGNNNSKSLTITSTMRGMLDDPCPSRLLPIEDRGKKVTYRQALAKSLLNHGIQGKQGAVSEILDRLEGKVASPVSLTGAEGKEIVFRVIRG